MGTQKLTDLTDDGILEFEEESELEKAENAENAQLDDALAQFRGVTEGNYYIYRMRPGVRNGEFIDKFAVADYHLDDLLLKLRDEYLGGEFRLDVRDKKGIVRGRHTVNVEKQPEKKIEEKKEDTLTPLMAMMQSMQESTQALITQMAMNQKDAEIRAAESNSSMLLKMMELTKPDKKPSFFDDPAAIITALASVKDIIAPKTDETDKMLKFMTLGKEMASGGDENVLQTALSTFGKPIADMAGAMASTPKTPTQTDKPATPVIPTPQPVPVDTAPPAPGAEYSPNPQEPTPTTEKESEQSMSEEQQQSAAMMAYEIEKMCTAASKGADPVFWADIVIETFGEEMTAQYIGNETMYGMLFTVYPNTANYRPWFDEVRKNVISFLSDSETEDRESTNVQDARGIIAPPNTPATASEIKESSEFATDGLLQQSPTSGDGELPASRPPSNADTSTETHNREDNDTL